MSFLNEHRAVITSIDTLSAIHWRKYLLTNWVNLTEGLSKIRILIVTGVHGDKDGGFGGDAENVKDCHNQVRIISKKLQLDPISAEFLVIDMKDFFGDNSTFNEFEFLQYFKNFHPHLTILSICFSQVSKVKNVLERSGLFPELKLERNLVVATKGRVIELDENQKNLIATVAKPENIEKSVVIKGPEGAGKTLLGTEIAKLMVNHYYCANSIKPKEGKEKIHVIISACFKKANEVKLLMNQLEESLSNDLKAVCRIEFKPVQATKSVQNPKDFNAIGNLVQELVKDANKSQKPYEKTILMIDELNPDFETSDWQVYRPMKKVQIIFSLKYAFDDYKIKNKRDDEIESTFEQQDDIIVFDHIVIGSLHKSHRCSNEIREFVYYLLIHSSEDEQQFKFKSFHHDQLSFNTEIKPKWLETKDAKSFITYLKAESKLKKETDVILIYDPLTIRRSDSSGIIEGYCRKQKWKIYSEEEIVGAEASTVIIYDLEQFHFESFTRAINHLIIVTTSATDGSLKRALVDMRHGKHNDDECFSNCNANGSYFKQIPHLCPYRNNSLSPSKLIEDRVLMKEEHETEETENEQASLIEPHQNERRHFSRRCKVFSMLVCIMFASLISGIIFVIIRYKKDIKPKPNQPESYVLIATGYPLANGSKTEVLDLTDPHFQCNNNLPSYPHQMTSGAGGLINGIPFLCGGTDARVPELAHVYQDCFMLQAENKTWIKSIRGLDKPIHSMGTGNVVIQNKLLINGGIWGFNSLKSSQLISLDMTMNLQDLPYVDFNHCIIQINATVFIVTGGGGDENCFTYFYNIDSQTWRAGPDLIESRTLHGCSKFILDNKTILLVTGGLGKEGGRENKLKSVEYLDLSKPNAQWVKGNDLPFGSVSHRMVSFDNNTYITGGDVSNAILPISTDKILILSCPEQALQSCQFIESQIKMKNSRHRHIALPITREFVKKLCP